MSFWKYKAFNDQQTIIEDVADSPTFPQLAFALRQKGLQIIEATSIQPFEYQAELRLKKLKMRIDRQSQTQDTTTTIKPENQRNDWSIHRFIKQIIALFCR